MIGKIGMCREHGRLMLHSGKCHDCRDREPKKATKCLMCLNPPDDKDEMPICAECRSKSIICRRWPMPTLREKIEEAMSKCTCGFGYEDCECDADIDALLALFTELEERLGKAVPSLAGNCGMCARQGIDRNCQNCRCVSQQRAARAAMLEEIERFKKGIWNTRKTIKIALTARASFLLTGLVIRF